MADRSRSRSPRNQETPLEATPLTYADLVAANRRLIQQTARWETENEALKAEIASLKGTNAELKLEIERMDVEMCGCSKCKGSASGTYGRLCEDCYFEEHPSEEESSEDDHPSRR